MRNEPELGYHFNFETQTYILSLQLIEFKIKNLTSFIVWRVILHKNVYPLFLTQLYPFIIASELNFIAVDVK